jgi:HEAT repeat protein/beta-lactamase regulating signal transducer with metallopeptidase domain
MNPIEAISEPLATTLGWTLVHFLWQGTLVALLLAGVLGMLRQRAANARYAAACVALLAMSVLPPATVLILSQDQTTSGQTVLTVPVLKFTPGESQVDSVGTIEPVAVSGPRYWAAGLRHQISSSLGWLTLIWALGVLFLSCRLVGGWCYARRLKTRGVTPAGEECTRLLDQLRSVMRVAVPVRLMESTLASVPTVIGWLKPVVLLPAAALTGLTVRQLTGIIAHELAHIRRYDYLVNILQSAVETLLFYHPAVWWVSRKIRIERENCCDDLAVSACGDAQTYARALLVMEELRSAQPQLAMAATGGLLMKRIERLSGVQSTRVNRVAGRSAAIFVVTVLFAGGIAANLKSQSQAAETNDQMALLTHEGDQLPGAVPTEADPAERPGAYRAAAAATHSEPPDSPRGAASTERSAGSEPADPPPAPAPGPEPRNQLPAPHSAVSGSAGQSTFAELFEALNSPSPLVRATAACSLGKLNAIEAIPQLIALLGDESPIEPLNCWSTGEWSPALRSFKQPSPGEQAAIAIASMGSRAVHPLVAALDSANPAVRRNAAWAIGEIRGGPGTDRRAAAGPLVATLSDTDSWVRAAAAFSLGEMRSAAATEALIAALGDSDWRVRDMSARALGEMKSRSGLEQLGSALLRDENGRVRRKAAWALGEIRDPAALDVLTAALNDQDQQVRSAAKWAISEIRD